MRTRLILMGFALIAFGVGCEPSPKKKSRSTARVDESGAFCLLSGTLQPAKKKDGFETLGNMIRLKFDSLTLESCREQVVDYCRARATEGFISENMTMIYAVRPSAPKKDRFRVTVNCRVEPIRDE